MFLRVPAMNRSLNRENPDILNMMIAGKQIIRGVEDDKRDQRERKMGPVKPATQMSATAPNTLPPPLLSCLFVFTLLTFPLNLWLFYIFHSTSTLAHPSYSLFHLDFIHKPLSSFSFHGFLLQLLVFNVQRLDNIIWQRRKSLWGLRKWNSCFRVGMLEEEKHVSVRAKQNQHKFGVALLFGMV